MKKLLVLLIGLWFAYTTQTFGQKKRQWEIGAGLDAYRCELNNVSHEKISNFGFSGVPFSQKRYIIPMAYNIYARISPFKTMPNLKLQIGIGKWRHSSEINFNGLYQPPIGLDLNVNQRLEIKVDYLHFPANIQYHRKLGKYSSVYVAIGIDIDYIIKIQDNYNKIIFEMIGFSPESFHNHKTIYQPRISAGYEYQFKRHALSLTPFIRLGSYDAISQDDLYWGFYHNLSKAKWRTPYGIGLQYFYSISKL